MNNKLKTVLQKGMTIGYEYDFGSTTELVIEVKDYRTGCDNKEKLTILSRNNAATYLCGSCGKREAAYIDVYRVYDGNPFLCEECSQQGGGEELRNSACQAGCSLERKAVQAEFFAGMQMAEIASAEFTGISAKQY